MRRGVRGRVERERERRVPVVCKLLEEESERHGSHCTRQSRV